MKPALLIVSVLGAALCLTQLLWTPKTRFVWNRTSSAPIGLYEVMDGPYAHGQWVLVSSENRAARWAETYGLIGSDWPLIKQIAGLPGDEICRHETIISINGAPVAEALLETSSDLNMPAWQGCFELQDGEVFLLNAHPRSLDGRYFGQTKLEDLEGVVTHISPWRDE
ncbi:MAG: S26 family signal peptidase [Pseudomonadota bacterium]